MIDQLGVYSMIKLGTMSKVKCGKIVNTSFNRLYQCVYGSIFVTLGII